MNTHDIEPGDAITFLLRGERVKGTVRQRHGMIPDWSTDSVEDNFPLASMELRPVFDGVDHCMVDVTTFGNTRQMFVRRSEILEHFVMEAA